MKYLGLAAAVTGLALLVTAVLGAGPGPLRPAVGSRAGGAGPGAAGAPAPGTARGSAPAMPAQSSFDLRERLISEAAKGRLTDTVLAGFRDYAAAVAHARLVPAAVSEEFWAWLWANKDLREGVVIGLYPEYDPAVLKCLAALKERFGDKAGAYPHLALAFSVVYGRAKGGSIRDPHVRWADKGRPVPTMEESFDYYLKHEKAMRMSLKTTPWPILALVADNDLPIEERLWALQKYANLQPAGFGKIYYDVQYDDDKRRGSPRIGDRPVTLQNILTYGGVCADQAYYASRVLKSMGVPAMYDCGQGERGGHAWVAWVGRDGQSADLLFCARFDYDRYYTGNVYCPITGRTILDRDVQLTVAALTRSYPGYLDAVAACHVYMMFEGADRAKVIDLLEGAIQKNPYLDTPWRLMAKGVAEGVIPQKQGERLYETMLKSFAGFPDLTFEVLQQILAPRLAADKKPPEAEVARNIQILEKVFQVYEGAQRPDLAVRLRTLQGQYLEAVGRRDEALRLYVLASERYATEHFGFLSLYSRAVEIMKADGKQDMMLKYMKMVSEKVPEYQSESNRRFSEVNPVFVTVVKAYAAALRSAGKVSDAEVQEARLPKPKDKA